MSDPSSFVMLTILMVVAVIAIFAMKYASQAFRARTEAGNQQKSDHEIAQLRETINAMNARLTRIETLLREVE